MNLIEEFWTINKLYDNNIITVKKIFSHFLVKGCTFFAFCSIYGNLAGFVAIKKVYIKRSRFTSITTKKFGTF